MLKKNKKTISLLRIIIKTCGAVLVVVQIAVGTLFVWLQQSLPKLDGDTLVSGPTAPIEILRDLWGIPHIFATTPNDAYFGLGFVHAQDRMFQMEQQRRLSQGRLSEMLGPMTAEFDRFMRLLDLHRASQASIAALDPAARESLNAYAAGVNAYMATHDGALAPELALLFADRPELWSAADSIAWLKVMALHLGGNWRQEALRAAMIEKLGPEKAASFYPGLPVGSSDIINEALGVDAAAISNLLSELLPLPGQGSNNWVVDGRHTASGRPLLANDPHLGFSIPAVWYLAHLEAPGLSVAGATLPGMPLVIVGTNGRIAWGVTNAGPDTQDLFVERFDPENPTMYLTPEGSESFAVREETIGVRFAEDEEVSMLETRHGPIMTGIREQVAALTAEGEAIALAWTMLQDDDRSIEAGLAVHTAHDWSDFVASGRNYAGPMQNIVYADRRGNIGLLSPAVIPIRNSGDGLIPAEGWTGEADWIGEVPYHDLPSLLNPATGIIATANDRLVDDNYPYLLGHQWQPGYRADRIREVLQTSDQHDFESFTSLQRDTQSLFAEALLPFATGSLPQTEAGRRLQAALRGWEGNMDAELITPTIFQAWYRELTRSIYEDDLEELFLNAWWFRPTFALSLMEADPQGWCSNSQTGEAFSCMELSGRAFDRAAEFLEERFGGDAADWVWGDVHELKLRHRLFSLVPGLDGLTGVDVALGGGSYTVAAASYAFNSGEQAFAPLHGPVLRAVVDMAEPVTGYFVILPGQSGNPFSPYYDNLVDRWLANEPLPIPFDRDHIDTAHQLVLTPDGP
ncbi:MAG: penicillin acylase family protein [Rhodospirillaceae bacterium]|nr:penicillin acylase family protein [Rhodospirillaceae bacterium]